MRSGMAWRRLRSKLHLYAQAAGVQVGVAEVVERRLCVLRVFKAHETKLSGMPVAAAALAAQGQAVYLFRWANSWTHLSHKHAMPEGVVRSTYRPGGCHTMLPQPERRILCSPCANDLGIGDLPFLSEMLAQPVLVYIRRQVLDAEPGSYRRLLHN